MGLNASAEPRGLGGRVLQRVADLEAQGRR